MDRLASLGGKELKAKTSSLFDVGERKVKHVGSSTVSFTCEPRGDEDGPSRVKKVYYENTYQLDPPAKFRADKVKPIIEEVLQTNLQGFMLLLAGQQILMLKCWSDIQDAGHLGGRKYEPIEISILSKALAEDIKQRVKELDFKRYKLISEVMIGQKNDQGVQIGSRYLWDAERDNFAAASYHNRHIFAVGSVYALYYE